MKTVKATNLSSPKPASAPGQAGGAESRPKESIRERAQRADIRKALSILKQAGKGNSPIPGDER